MYWLATLTTPQMWRAGYSGAGGDRKPFYFACAKCGKEAPIAGYLSASESRGSGETLENVCLITSGTLPRLALYCADCWPTVVSEHEAKGD